jgi:diguanylate cyclase (GGDEF)-like protein/PAS domain S-box-containing protein
VRVVHHDGGHRVVEVVADNLLDDPDVGAVVLAMWDVTDRVAAEEALRASEARFRALLRNASDMIAVHRKGVFTYVSPAVTRILGWSPDEIVGRTVASVVHPDHHEELRRRIGERQQGVPSSGANRYRLLHRDGHWIWFETISSTYTSEPGVEGVDITATIEAEEALRASEQRHRALVEHLSDIIVVADAEGTATYVSPAISRVLGWSAEAVTGRSLFDGMHRDDVERTRARLHAAVAGGPGLYGPDRFRYLRSDGAWRHVETTASNRLDDDAVGGIVFIVRDVTAQVDAEERLRHLALHDPLTGLANRTLVKDRLQVALAAGRRQGTTTALLVVDLDHFKDVNDGLGHEAGDAVLEELARRMAATLRDVDTVGRLGGDEFAAVLPAAGTVGEALDAGRRLLEALAVPVRHQGEDLQLGGSIGVALAPDHGDDVDSLLRHADAAMFRAKADRSGLAVFHDADERGRPALGGAGRSSGG